MRVSSLSDDRVISLLSRYFVPALLSRDHYQADGPSAAEKEEVLRIDRDRRARGLKGGAVCVYILAPDGTVLATQPVQFAWRPDNLVPFLKEIVDGRRLRPRDTEAVKASTAPAPAAVRPRTEDGLVLHFWTRFDGKGANRGVSQDRVELTAAEWRTVVPPAESRLDASWAVPEKVAHKMFLYCYPPGPHWSANASKVLGGGLSATLISLSATEARVRLTGKLELAFPFSADPKGRADGNTTGRVTARLTGLVTYNPAERKITSWVMASDEAEYVRYWQGKGIPTKMLIAVENER
jgi:hypothetical protein